MKKFFKIFIWGKWHDRFSLAIFLIVIFLETGLFTAIAFGMITFRLKANEKWINETTGLLKVIANRIKGK